MDEAGPVLCTCIGSMEYRLLRTSETKDKSRQCVHISGFKIVIKAFSSSFEMDFAFASRLLACVFQRNTREAITEYFHSLPRIHNSHKGSVTVVATSEKIFHGYSVLFVPVRRITKGAKRNICTFCDNTLGSQCHHTRSIANVSEDALGTAGMAFRQKEEQENEILF